MLESALFLASKVLARSSKLVHKMEWSSQDLVLEARKILECCVESRHEVDQQPILRVTQPDTAHRIQTFARPQRHPQPIDSILENARQIYDYRARMDHPKFFGFIPSPASDYSWLGEILNTGFNPFAGSWFQSSGPSAIEQSLVQWMAQDLLHLPESSGGCFVSGGSVANLSALMVARDHKLSFEERPQATIYVSEQTHSSVAKGLRILGFHDRQIRKVECDDEFRINTTVLRQMIKDDRQSDQKPFLIVGSCGTTNTGSIDPFRDLSSIAKSEDLWLHADGAYGASASLSKTRKHLLDGVELCDSISWDAHKWLFQTYGCGMVFVRDRKLLVDTFRTGAEYIQDAADGPEEFPNFWNRSVELTRPARAMKLWFSFQMLGLDKIENAVERGFELAELAERELRALNRWEIFSSAKMGIVCFRFQPWVSPSDNNETVENIDGGDEQEKEREIEDLNKQISRVALEKNVAAALTTRLRGKLVLRICSIHPGLRDEEMVDTIKGLDEIARDLLLCVGIQKKREVAE